MGRGRSLARQRWATLGYENRVTGSSGSPSNGQLGDSAGRRPWELFIEVRVCERRCASRGAAGGLSQPRGRGQGEGCASEWRPQPGQAIATCGRGGDPIDRDCHRSHCMDAPGSRRTFALRSPGAVRDATSLRRSGRKATPRAYDAMIAQWRLQTACPCTRATPMTSRQSTASRWSPSLTRITRRPLTDRGRIVVPQFA
jgi:hypothetical protein